MFIQNTTYFMLSTIFFLNRAFDEIMLKNMVEGDRTKMAIQWYVEKMRFACRISEARTQTHTRKRPI